MFFVMNLYKALHKEIGLNLLNGEGGDFLGMRAMKEDLVAPNFGLRSE